MPRHAILAVAALVLLTGSTTACTAPGARSGALPTAGAAGSTGPATNAWLDSPASVPQQPEPTPRPEARPCTAADLPSTATFTGSGGISQTDSKLVVVRNVGRSACTPASDVRFQNTDARGVVHDVVTERYESGPGPAGPATIEPGESARLLIVMARCQDDSDTVTYRGISLIAAGRRIRVPGLRIGGCQKLMVGQWWPPQPDQTSPPAPRYAALTSVIEAPDTVRAGDTLQYTVVLTNPGPDPVRLDPCPVYQELFYKGLETYLLNCSPGTIGAGTSVRFAMRVQVPAFTPAGANRLTWMIKEIEADSAPASALINVTT
jgi:hypothetical protein